MSTKRALVTGSARGIGRAIAEALAASGHAVVGVDVLRQAVGPLTAAVHADLADAMTAAAVVAEHGPFDILVNNAAVLITRPITGG